MVEVVSDAAELMVLALPELEDHITGLVRVQICLSHALVVDLLSVLATSLYIEINVFVVRY